MPIGATRSQGSSGENICHFNGIRLRVVGSGGLRMSLWSLDQINNADFPVITMAATTNIQPFKMINFMEQRAQLKIETVEIDEWFKINRLIFFVKPTFVEYPS
jgi:hypothetical protein